MNKLILVLLSFFLPIITKGQIDEAKVSVGAVFSSDRCYRSLSSGSNPGIEIAEHRDKLETPKFGYTSGVSFEISIGNRFGLESGMLFSDKGYNYKIKPDNSLNNPSDPNLPVTLQQKYHYYYLDVPVKINYYLTHDKVKLFVSAGTSANILLFQKLSSKFELQNGDVKSSNKRIDEGLSSVNVAALAGFGVDYEITDNVKVRIEPIYRRSVTSIVNAPVKGYLSSAGVNVGVFYSF